MARRSPKKPYPDFPLTLHSTGQWCKKIRGRVHYFGKDADDALRRYLDQRDDLYAGRTAQTDSVTVADLCNHFLTIKEQQVASGELTARTFQHYHSICARVIKFFSGARSIESLRPTDFASLRAELSRGVGLVTLRNHIRNTRILFLHAEHADLIDGRIRFGQFKQPSKSAIRKEANTKRQKHGRRRFTAAEIRAVLDETTLPYRAMTLLGINCGFGQTDCATLPQSAIDLQTGWVDFPRPKTGIERRCPLWPETMQAIQKCAKSRPAPNDPADDDLLFVTVNGNRFVHLSESGAHVDVVSDQFGKLLRRLGIWRRGLNFYALRHTFETEAGATRDQVAVDYIMGHSSGDMGSLYREGIQDDRLLAITDSVRGWLFSS